MTGTAKTKTSRFIDPLSRLVCSGTSVSWSQGSQSQQSDIRHDADHRSEISTLFHQAQNGNYIHVLPLFAFFRLLCSSSTVCLRISWLPCREEELQIGLWPQVCMLIHDPRHSLGGFEIWTSSRMSALASHSPALHKDDGTFTYCTVLGVHMDMSNPPCCSSSRPVPAHWACSSPADPLALLLWLAWHMSPEMSVLPLAKKVPAIC